MLNHRNFACDYYVLYSQNTIAVITVEEARELLTSTLQECTTTTNTSQRAEDDVPKRPKITYQTSKSYHKPYKASVDHVRYRHSSGESRTEDSEWSGESPAYKGVQTSTIKLYRDEAYLRFLFTTRYLTQLIDNGFTGKAR